MASWKLIVEDYGKIKSAQVEILPLTLFVGDNNSGKSYLLALLWGIEFFGVEGLIGREYSQSQENDKLIAWIQKQIESTIENGKQTVYLEEVAELLQVVLNHELEKNKNNLVRKIFNSENINIGKLCIELRDIEKKKLHFQITEDKDFLEVEKDRFSIEISAYINGKTDIKKEIAMFVLGQIYSILMDIRWDGALHFINSHIYLPAAKTGFMLTKDIINKFGRKNTFNMYYEREQVTPFIRPINQFLDVMEDLRIESFGTEKCLQLVSDLENEMTYGTIEFSTMPNKEIQYMPIGCKESIPLRLSSAVVTELSPLILILKHKSIINKFYYEEPEMCLHPQLQHKMGKFIVRAVNSGIGMVITTHSDIILQHINNMIKLAKHEDCEVLCEKFGYEKQDLLFENQVKVYQFEEKGAEKTKIRELICGENGFAVQTFNDALDMIMDEAYEIQG